MCCPAHPPAHNPTCEGVDDEGHIDKALPTGQVCKVRNPEPVRRRSLELAVHPIERVRSRFIRDGRAHWLATNDTLQAHRTHEPSDGAAGHTKPLTLLIDKGNHRFSGRSSAAIAKYADALRKNSLTRTFGSLACRSSRFSRSRAFIFSATSLGRPTLFPVSTSVFLTQSCNVAGEHPILAAMEETAAHRDGYSAWWSRTIRMTGHTPP